MTANHYDAIVVGARCAGVSAHRDTTPTAKEQK